MPLFPAYAQGKTEKNDEDDTGVSPILEDELLSESHDEDALYKEVRTTDESELLKSDSSSGSSSSEHIKVEVQDDKSNTKKRKRKHRKRSKDTQSKRQKKNLEENFGLDKDLDFYIDRKRDYGNLHFSTLYFPGRPQYHHTNFTVGLWRYDHTRKAKKVKRYFDKKIQHESEITPIDSEKLQTQSASICATTANLRSVEKITDSGLKWNDDKVEAVLLDKTEYFNKCLTETPYDIDMWLQFIKFQEDRYTFDVCNARAASESSARNVLYTKQLAIIDKCLNYNPYNKDIIMLKVKISEQSLPSDQYLILLKSMVAESGIRGDLLCKLWLRYIEGVQCSMALCSVPCVKEMYVGAVKALSRAQAHNYQSPHVEITYLFGLFLRQSGLWEQLWLLLKLNVEMNLAVSATAAEEASKCFSQNLPHEEEERENEMLKQEAKVISSGLPLHTVWWRCVRAREAQHWRPAPLVQFGGKTPPDPQRLAYPTDILDLLEPITGSEHLFKLAVNIIRLFKVPILPLTNGAVEILNDTMGPLNWDVDAIEFALVFVYSILDSFDPIDDSQMKATMKIMADFVEQPTYFEDSNGFLSFVNDVMLNCSNWFSGREKTALLVWWIRLQRVLLVLNRSNQSESCRVLKQVQKVLKANKTDVVLYTEFAALETALGDWTRGLQVLHTALNLAMLDTQLLHAYISRSYVKSLLEHGRATSDSKDAGKAINVLISLTKSKLLGSGLTNTYTESELTSALNKFSDQTDTLLLWMRDDTSPFNLVDVMYPDLYVEWICCHGWFLYLSQPPRLLTLFYDKIMLATTTDNVDASSDSYRRIRWVRENFMAWYSVATDNNRQLSIAAQLKATSRKQAEDCLRLYPFNACLVWSQTTHGCVGGPTGRWRLFTLANKSEAAQTLLALAMVFADFICLYQKDDPSREGMWQTGHSNRLLHLLQTFTKNVNYRRCALLWKLRIYFESVHTNRSQLSLKNTLYLALDECPWNKDIYSIGCTHLPSEFSELIDLIMEKQLRLHAMPEELQPL